MELELLDVSVADLGEAPMGGSSTKKNLNTTGDLVGMGRGQRFMACSDGGSELAPGSRY
ncbi:hypothetical protein [Amycolatopsis jiangsuensis]|uniref:Uncharacterized protein n=1 Tax=Amycolatopsis jiangsuensis TaxID=1181879 RepID=A0A840IUX2_9PSEU|nr:hypothetical protein [Amycolatopsis jiangsuensis]MBB4685670.1 hypothetical protein [Amycolatopsis jiangsuensis]